MTTFRYTDTLYFYDAPQVIEGRDAIGGHYIGVLLAGGNDRYLVAGVEPAKLHQFMSGEIDLRSLIISPAGGGHFIASGSLSEPLILAPVNADEVESKYLPEDGFFLHEHAADSPVLSEARTRNNFVLDLTVDPPEARDDHRIRANTLTGLLQHVQTLVKHAYGAALRELTLAARKEIDRTDAHTLDVVIPAMPGSFRIVLEGGKRPDLLGHSELSRAMERIDTLFDTLDQSETVLARLRDHKGHLSGAFSRLLGFLASHDTGLRYQWATPELEAARSRSISHAQSSALIELLSGVSNLGSESIVLEGTLEEADLARRSWRLITDNGKETGTVPDNGPSLEGLRLGARYRFDCIEELDEADATGRETRRVYLMGYAPIQ